MKVSDLLRGDFLVRDDTVIRIYDERESFVTKGKWYTDNILELVDCEIRECRWVKDKGCRITLEGVEEA